MMRPTPPTKCRPDRQRKPALARRPTLEHLEDRCLLSGDVVLEWTGRLLDAGRARGQGTTVLSRSMAIMEAAIYDSVNAVDRASTPYFTDVRAPAGTSAKAAAAQAAHDVAVRLYPGTGEVATFDAALVADLRDVPDGQGEDDGVALGKLVAARILESRARDGSS